jgi:hypothetical protein
MFKRKNKNEEERFSESPELFAGRIVQMFADQIQAFLDAPPGKELKVWIGVDPDLAESMKMWIGVHIKGMLGAEKAKRYLEVVLETKEQESYEISIVRK